MNVYVPLALEAVEQLDAELQRIHQCVRAIAVWPATSNVELASIRASIRRAKNVTRRIMDHVIERSETISASFRAASLRARAIVLAVETSEIELAARRRCGTVETARFHNVIALKDYLLAEVGRINARWIGDLKSTDVSNEEAIIARAEAAYAKLGSEPEVAEFLSAAALHDSFALRSAARVIAALLDVPVSSGTDDDTTAMEVPSLPTLVAHRVSRKTAHGDK